MFSPLIDRLIESLRCLPGVGPKTAQRMALHLLERDQQGAALMAQTIADALANVGNCQRCRTLCETELCSICDDPRRDQSLICVVETPADVLAIESTGTFKGTYFVLMGHLSPIDGIGPEDIGVDVLLQRAQDHKANEVILATNPTVEGEATAFYLTEQLKQLGIMVTRIAHGVPLGGELEYVDGGTLAHALSGRKVVD